MWAGRIRWGVLWRGGLLGAGSGDARLGLHVRTGVGVVLVVMFPGVGAESAATMLNEPIGVVFHVVGARARTVNNGGVGVCAGMTDVIKQGLAEGTTIAENELSGKTIGVGEMALGWDVRVSGRRRGVRSRVWIGQMRGHRPGRKRHRRDRGRASRAAQGRIRRACR
jgi:hypothetical protein